MPTQGGTAAASAAGAAAAAERGRWGADSGGERRRRKSRSRLVRGCREILPVAEAVIVASGVDFRIGGSQAFYVLSEDYGQVPQQPAFFQQ